MAGQVLLGRWPLSANCTPMKEHGGKPHLILATPEFKVTDGTRTEVTANSLSGG